MDKAITWHFQVKLFFYLAACNPLYVTVIYRSLVVRYFYVTLKYGGPVGTLSKRTPNFKTVAQMDVPHQRDGKHKGIVTEILDDLTQLKKGSAIRIPLKELTDTKENVRSALNRATRKANIAVATATDKDFLYVWKAEELAK